MVVASLKMISTRASFHQQFFPLPVQTWTASKLFEKGSKIQTYGNGNKLGALLIQSKDILLYNLRNPVQ